MNLTEQFPGPGESLIGGDAFQVAYYALVSMLVLVGIAYLLSKVMHNRRLEDWAKEEFLQVFVSAAIVGGFVALLAPESGIIIKAFQSLIPTDLMNAAAIDCIGSAVQPGSIICYAFSYLGQLQNQIMAFISGLFIINIVLDVVSKISVDVIIVEITPLSGLASFVQVFNSIIQTLLFLQIMAVVEKSLLIFANATALTIFLPIGVVLRCFFATRRIGGTLIAIAIGAYLIFPLCIALNGIAVADARANAIANVADSMGSASTAVLGYSPYANLNESGDLNPDNTRDYIDTVTTGASSIVDAVMSIPNAMATFIGTMIVEVVILPVVSLMITMIAIKELSGLLGGEVNLSKFEV